MIVRACFPLLESAPRVEKEGGQSVAALLDIVGALRWADLVLQSQLAVRWLPSTLTVRCPFLGLKFFDSHGTKLMDVAAAKARTVRTVPVLFHDHGTTAAGTNSGRSGLHRYFEPPSLGRIARRLVPAWPSRASGDTKRPFASNRRQGLPCASEVN
jgi:hypothetical protein